jgi:hypothetical protein
MGSLAEQSEISRQQYDAYIATEQVTRNDWIAAQRRLEASNREADAEKTSGPGVTACAPMITVAMVIVLSLGAAESRSPTTEASERSRSPPLNPFPAEQDWSFLSRPMRGPRDAHQAFLKIGPHTSVCGGVENRKLAPADSNSPPLVGLGL